MPASQNLPSHKLLGYLQPPNQSVAKKKKEKKKGNISLFRGVSLTVFTNQEVCEKDRHNNHKDDPENNSQC